MLDDVDDFSPARKLFLTAEYDAREGDVPVATLVERFRDLAPVTGAVHALVELRALRDGGRVLDLGTGAGTFALAMAHANPRVEVVGLDFSAGAVAAARRAASALALTNARFDVGDFETGSLPEADAAVVAYALSLVADPVLALRNVAAALRPEGRLVVFDGVLPWMDVGPVPPERLDDLAREANFELVGRVDLTGDVREIASRGRWPWADAPSVDARFFASGYRRR